MIPSSATPRRRTSQRRRPRNAASASVRGSAAAASARALAAGLWRLRHAERMMAGGASPAHAAQTQPVCACAVRCLPLMNHGMDDPFRSLSMHCLLL